MFDLSTRLVIEQDEISGVETIGWENRSWKQLSLVGDEGVRNVQLRLFGFCIVSWQDSRTFPNRTMHGTKN